MHRALPTVIAATFAMLAADGALASSQVALAFSDPAYAAEYSQGLNLELTLTDGSGAPVAGRVSVELQPDDGGAVILVTEPDVLVDAAGQELDLAGLRALADRITVIFRAEGHPFCQAFLPKQEIKEEYLRTKATRM